MRTDEQRVTLEWLKQGLRDDPFFPGDALEVLEYVDPQSTHTVATSAESLVEWWLTERELKCYERGEVVKDITAAVLFPDDTGSMEAAERAIELAWRVDRGEFVSLLYTKGLRIPEFLRLKTLPLAHEGPNEMGYTLEEAAAEIAANGDVHQAELRDRIREAAERGELEFLDPATGLPFKPKVRRDFYERISTANLNAWFEAKGVRYRLRGPNDGATESDSVGLVEDEVGSLDRNEVMRIFQVEPRDTDNLKFWDDKLSRPPEWLIGARVSTGKAGVSSRWNPLLVAHALLGRAIRGKPGMTLRQLDTAIHARCPEILERWKEETDDQR